MCIRDSLSGGPSSVYEKGAAKFDSKILDLEKFGILRFFWKYGKFELIVFTNGVSELLAPPWRPRRGGRPRGGRPSCMTTSDGSCCKEK